MSVIVVGHVVLFDQFDTPQPLHVNHPFKTGHDQSERETLLGTHGLAVLRVAYQTIVHGFCDGKADRAFYGLRPFRDEEGRTILDAGFFE